MRKRKNGLYNQLNVIGRLCTTPQKRFTKDKKLFTRFLIKTCCQDEVFIPFIMFGREVDIVCTKFQKGDIVAITAQVSTRESRQQRLLIDFIVSEIKLITKSKVVMPTEDKFQMIVELYDKDVIDRRIGKRGG